MNQPHMIGSNLNRPYPDARTFDADRRNSLNHTFYIAALRGDAHAEAEAFDNIVKNFDMKKQIPKAYKVGE